MAPRVKLHLPQEDGELKLTDFASGIEPVTHHVHDHIVSVDASEVELILSVVDGARLAPEGKDAQSPQLGADAKDGK